MPRWKLPRYWNIFQHYVPSPPPHQKKQQQQQQQTNKSLGVLLIGDFKRRRYSFTHSCGKKTQQNTPAQLETDWTFCNRRLDSYRFIIAKLTINIIISRQFQRSSFLTSSHPMTLFSTARSFLVDVKMTFLILKQMPPNLANFPKIYLTTI